MDLIRFYSDSITRPVSYLGGQESHHLAAVLRLQKGGKVELFDGKGSLAVGVISEANSRRVTVEIQELNVFQRPGRFQIIIASSVAKGSRFDELITKCTELGVDRITPLIFSRTVKQPKNPEISTRWGKLAVSAAKQSKNLFLPQIDNPVTLEKALNNFKTDYANPQILFGSLEQKTESLIEKMIDSPACVAIIGPEGGITQEERNLLKDCSALPVKITDSILRVETAALAFAAILAAGRLYTRVV